MSRKLQITFIFLACGTWLGSIGIYQGRDLLGVAGVIAALAAGILSVMQGFKAEYQAKGVPQVKPPEEGK